MKKKIVALTLVVAMLAIAVIGGTLAYFTDTDAEANTFTVGSVDIDLIESQYHRVVDAAEGADEVSDDVIKADAETYQDAYLAVNGKDIVPGRWVRKAPYILNTGKNPAYVRVRLLVDRGFGTYLHMMETTTAQDDGSITVEYGTREINGVTYDELTYTYTMPLEPEELTYWPAFWQFKLDDACDNEDVRALIEAGALIQMEDGTVKFDIIVEADAIQAEGFASAEEAFAAFETQEPPQE